MTEADWMMRAIAEARRGIAAGQSPFGAVVARDGEVVAAAHNTVQGDTDPTAHAEVNVLRVAAKVLIGGNEYRIVSWWMDSREEAESELAETEAALESGTTDVYQRHWIMVKESELLGAEIQEATSEEAAKLEGPPPPSSAP